MALPQMTTEISVIQGLPDRPNDAGYTAEELKALFDQAGEAIKAYLNETLLPALESGGAGNIGIETIEGLTAATVQEALAALKTAVDGATTGTIPDGSLTTAKYGAKSVTASKIADGTITSTQLGSGCVNAAKLGSSAVETGKLKNGAVTEPKLASAAVTEPKLGTGAVTAAKLGPGAVITEKLADGAVTPAKTSGIQPEHTALTVTVPAIAAGGSVTVTVTGVTASNTVLVTPEPGSFLAWRNSGVFCSAQGAGTLTFYAEGDAAQSEANVVILN